MQNRRHRLVSVLAFAILLVVVALALAAWSNRPGTLSWVNYERIQPGMTVEEVERLLGGPGHEVTVTNGLPQVADDNSPSRLKPVVSGERCLCWGGMGSPFTVVVSLRNGVVAEKWCQELSL